MHTISDSHVDARLISDLRSREQEVFDYQMNIDYYTAGIDLAKNVEAKADMEARVSSEKREQAKAQLYLDSILKRLEDKDIPALLVKYPAPEA